MSLRGFIKKYLVRRLGVPEIESSLRGLARRGFAPGLIFDIGAYRGEFAEACLAVWPAPPPEVVCFEAQESGLRRLRVLQSRQRVKIVEGLVGSQTLDRCALNEMETASSVLAEHIPQKANVTYHPMRTLDSVADRQFGGRPIDLLKIDTQGYELEVLKGAERSLSRVRVIVAELNLIDIHQGVPLFHEVVGWLGGRGYVAYDICGLTRRPLDGALWQADLLFVKIDDPLRGDKRWQA